MAKHPSRGRQTRGVARTDPLQHERLHESSRWNPLLQQPAELLGLFIGDLEWRVRVNTKPHEPVPVRIALRQIRMSIDADSLEQPRLLQFSAFAQHHMAQHRIAASEKFAVQTLGNPVSHDRSQILIRVVAVVLRRTDGEIVPQQTDEHVLLLRRKRVSQPFPGLLCCLWTPLPGDDGGRRLAIAPGGLTVPEDKFSICAQDVQEVP